MHRLPSLTVFVESADPLVDAAVDFGDSLDPFKRLVRVSGVFLQLSESGIGHAVFIEGFHFSQEIDPLSCTKHFLGDIPSCLFPKDYVDSISEGY